MGVFHASVSYEKWAKKENKRRWKEKEWKALKGRDRKFSKDRKQRVHGGGGKSREKVCCYTFETWIFSCFEARTSLIRYLKIPIYFDPNIPWI